MKIKEEEKYLDLPVLSGRELQRISKMVRKERKKGWKNLYRLIKK